MLGCRRVLFREAASSKLVCWLVGACQRMDFSSYLDAGLRADPRSLDIRSQAED
jgi:hypothetical protein